MKVIKKIAHAEAWAFFFCAFSPDGAGKRAAAFPDGEEPAAGRDPALLSAAISMGCIE